LSLLATHFLVLVNDNAFRWFAVGLGKHLVGPKYEGAVVSAGFACLILPYIVLAAPAGYLADRFSKRNVLIGCKLAEIVAMMGAIAAVWTEDIWLMMLAIAALGAIAALYGPAKLGIIPELVRPEKISSANGLMGVVTVIAVSIGTVVGNKLADWAIEPAPALAAAAASTANQLVATAETAGLAALPYFYGTLQTTAAFLLVVGTLGLVCSLSIDRVPAGDRSRRFPYNMFAQTCRDFGIVASNRSLMLVTLGSAVFWTLGGVAHLNVDYYTTRQLGLSQDWVGVLLGMLTIGVGLGSLLAGWWSAGKVELGLVPLGGLGIAASAAWLWLVPVLSGTAGDPLSAPPVATYIWLILLGVSSGLFDVPLAAYIQDRSPPAQRGSIMAAFNFMTFSGMLMAAVSFWLLRDVMQVSAPVVFLILSLMTLGVAVYSFVLIPRATIRFLIWLASRTFYRVKIRGLENIPREGGALLVSNHISWLDGVMIITMTARPIRFVVYGPYSKVWYLRWLASLFETIPVEAHPHAAKEAILAVRKALADGYLVCVFPEGGISRTGQIQTFKPGMMLMLRNNDIPVIPIYLDELWGSIFSFKGGKFFWKWPGHWPYPVTIHVGQPLYEPKDAFEVRAAVAELGVDAVHHRQKPPFIVVREMIRQCRRALFRSKIADSTGANMTGGNVLMRSLILRRLLDRRLGKDEKFVGVLLPPSAGGVLTNAAVSLLKRVAVNLNYTMPCETINYCIQQCGIRHVLTSRKVMEKLNLSLDAEVIYLEDLRADVTLAGKLSAAALTYLCPARLTESLLDLRTVQAKDLMTIIFTSGSTGLPKGVMLTNGNIGHNAEAIDQVVQLRRSDVLCGILPFFHSFGFTVTLWSVLALEIKGAYHFSPLEPRQVGKLCKDHNVTILVTTPTFLRSYLRRCEKEEFATLDVVVCGAEKLPQDLVEEFDAKFGVRPVEGYGTTELSPLVSVNVPPTRAMQSEQVGLKEGTVGRPVPGVLAKVIDLDSHADLGTDEAGMLLITGANVMQGYLHQPEKTAEVMHDRWYVTGDVAVIDRDGFIRITGRQSRFSKIGGEMVPHLRVEELLQSWYCGDDEALRIGVSAVPDARKGERLIVLYTQMSDPPAEACRKLGEAGLPNLWIPGTDSFFQVDAIPILGTGKLDLQKLKELAAEKAGSGGN
jgi:acyl-[acyl-carrier-protein]-phospholipid O-acyltransferase/long-chain-fatty-acid--[acyl-carrier-protein] ligase